MHFAQIATVGFSGDGRALELIDQTQLPGKLQVLQLKTQQEIWEAIHQLRVRGAPAIGIAAAIGLYLAALEIETEDQKSFLQQFSQRKAYLASARPTAVNLFWALDRMERVAQSHIRLPVDQIRDLLRQEAQRMLEEDAASCRRIGEYGSDLLREGDGVLTHCNAGRLATVRYGTALAPIYVAQEQGKQVRVFADETRPLLQGARLTAFELYQSGIDTTLLCDNMAATAMKNGWIQLVLVGADRIAANGDTANKIGTLGVAILARHYGIPFYVCAPLTTVDLNTPTGEEIQIEQRSPEEVTTLWYRERMAPEGVKVLNPAFDVTDHSFIAGIITDRGIARPPFSQTLPALFSQEGI